MRAQIKVGPVSDAHQLVPLALFLFTFGKKAIVNIDGALGIVRQLCFRLFVKPQVVGRNTDVHEPLITRVYPFLMDLFVLARPDKIFHFHLFELSRTKDEVTRRDFVAKRFANLRYAEGQLAPAGVEYVVKVDEDALRGFRSQIDECVGIIFSRRSDVRLKHEVERTDFCPILLTAIRTLDQVLTKTLPMRQENLISRVWIFSPELSVPPLPIRFM